MKISGIYQIRSRIKPDRIYIGSAGNIAYRWGVHLFDLRKNKHHSIKLQRHYNKYGKNDLIFSILIGCDKEDLIITEQFYLDGYKTYFNICKIAGSQLGMKRSEESCKKISESLKGHKVSEEARRKISKAMIGNKNGNISVNGFKKGYTPWNKEKKFSL